MTADSSIHVFWIQPMPGVADNARVIVAADNADKTSLVVVLPDNTQVLITADRAVCFRGGQMLTLSQWQYAPVSSAEYEQETEPLPEVPEVSAGFSDPAPEAPTGRGRGGTFTLGGRRTFA
jgi:hypothetical protein